MVTFGALGHMSLPSSCTEKHSSSSSSQDMRDSNCSQWGDETTSAGQSISGLTAFTCVDKLLINLHITKSRDERTHHCLPFPAVPGTLNVGCHVRDTKMPIVRSSQPSPIHKAIHWVSKQYKLAQGQTLISHANPLSSNLRSGLHSYHIRQGTHLWVKRQGAIDQRSRFGVDVRALKMWFPLERLQTMILESVRTFPQILVSGVVSGVICYYP